MGSGLRAEGLAAGAGRSCLRRCPSRPRPPAAERRARARDTGRPSAGWALVSGTGELRHSAAPKARPFVRYAHPAEGLRSDAPQGSSISPAPPHAPSPAEPLSLPRHPKGTRRGRCRPRAQARRSRSSLMTSPSFSTTGRARFSRPTVPCHSPTNICLHTTPTPGRAPAAPTTTAGPRVRDTTPGARKVAPRRPKAARPPDLGSRNASLCRVPNAPGQSRREGRSKRGKRCRRPDVPRRSQAAGQAVMIDTNEDACSSLCIFIPRPN